MKLFPTTGEISQHCPVGLENAFFQSQRARKAEGYGDEQDEVGTRHLCETLTVSAWQATHQTLLLCNGHATASLEAIHRLGLMSEAGNVN